jgi:hypothetical protein
MTEHHAVDAYLRWIGLLCAIVIVTNAIQTLL